MSRPTRSSKLSEPDRRVLQLRPIGVGHRAEMEGAQAVEGRFGQHGRSPSVSGWS